MSSVISVFGLGYVGCVSAACFANENFSVVGVDVSQSKVDRINSGRATILEAGIEELVSRMVIAGRLRATTDVAEAVAATSVSLICVGTPSRANGSIDLTYIERVCEQIGAAIARKSQRHVVVIRSTVMPGTIHDVVIPALARTSGKTYGVGFGVASNPEFLREGSSVKDFYDPPFTIIGADHPETVEALRPLYAGIDAPLHVTDVRVAETVKYACNSYHAVKVTFANEVGAFCKALGVDSHEVMRIFAEDRKLNISAAYLRPGFAFGGSCLPKDVRAIVHRTRSLDIETPLFAAMLESNDAQITRVVDQILASGHRRVGILGLAFKAGTDDLRESPLVTLVERLLGKGVDLRIYDRDVSASELVGANREYIEREVPHIWSLVRASIDDVLAHGDLLVIGNGSPVFRDLGPRLRAGQQVLDLVRAFGPRRSGGDYIGLAW